MSGVTKKVMDLTPGSDNVEIRVRVLEVTEPRVVETRSGSRTLSEAVVGDETGRVSLTLWGEHAGKLAEGQAIAIHNAFTTAYRGKVQLNVGRRGSIEEIDDSEVVKAEDVPEDSPEAPENWRPRRRYGGGYSRGYRRRF